MKTQTLTDPSGRVVVKFSDDRGVPYQYPTQNANLSGQANFKEIYRLDLKPDNSLDPPRPALVRGNILVAVQTTFDPAAVDYVVADLLVQGFIGSTPTDIMRAQVGGDATLLRVTFSEEDTYDKISIQGRALLRGLPTTDPAQTITVAVLTYMWS